MTIASSVLAYALVAGLLTMLPGPDTAVVLTTAIRAGRPAARRAALGIGCGLLFWGLAAALGLSAVLRATGEVYSIFRYACAAYLIWLAIRCFRSAARRSTDPTVDAATHASRPPKLTRFGWGFRRAFVTAALNPKLGIFFVAFLPQFIPRGVTPIGMTLLLSAVQAAEAVTWYIIIGALAAGAGKWLSRPRARRIMDSITGTVFATFGIAVVVEKTT
jgi:threonine/homoserine/homoserine lactone efflux protein